MVNFGPLAAKIGLVVWGSTANFNGFHVLAALLQRRCSMETNQTLQCLAISWAGTLQTFSGVPAPLRNFARCKIHFASSHVLCSHISGSVTAQHLSSGREPNFAALSTGRHLYLAGRPSRWALAYILVSDLVSILLYRNDHLRRCSVNPLSSLVTFLVAGIGELHHQWLWLTYRPQYIAHIFTY